MVVVVLSDQTKCERTLNSQHTKTQLAASLRLSSSRPPTRQARLLSNAASFDWLNFCCSLASLFCQCAVIDPSATCARLTDHQRLMRDHHACFLSHIIVLQRVRMCSVHALNSPSPHLPGRRFPGLITTVFDLRIPAPSQYVPVPRAGRDYSQAYCRLCWSRTALLLRGLARVGYASVHFAGNRRGPPYTHIIMRLSRRNARKYPDTLQHFTPPPQNAAACERQIIHAM